MLLLLQNYICAILCDSVRCGIAAICMSMPRPGGIDKSCYREIFRQMAYMAILHCCIVDDVGDDECTVLSMMGINRRRRIL